MLPKRNQSRRIRRNGANQYDTIQVMRKVALESAQNPYFKTLIDRYDLKRNYKDLERIFNFAFYNTYFKADHPEIQTIRSGMRSVNDLRANCVDYCILLSSFLTNIGMAHKFRMISTDPNKPENLSHIYTVTPYGVLDPVLGQDQDGTEAEKKRDKRTPLFLMEAPYVSKVDLRVF